jgi:ABC-2 type transport system permease protein
MPLFLYQLRGELWKLFARKRTYIGYGVFLGVELLVMLLLHLPRSQHLLRRMIENSGGLFDEYFSGLTVALMMMAFTLFMLGGLYIALIAGDIVAKEVEDGTMRMTLCRPVSRIRVLVLKYVVSVIYTFSLVFFVGLSALCVGLLVRGTGGLFPLIPGVNLLALYDFGPGLGRYLAALPCFGLSMLTFSTFAFQLSCWNVKPAAATISAITVFFVDWILHEMPYFESYRAWMMTTHMNTWMNVFREPLPWSRMVEDYAILAGLDATFFVVGAVVFASRDFKS